MLGPQPEAYLPSVIDSPRFCRLQNQRRYDQIAEPTNAAELKATGSSCRTKDSVAEPTTPRSGCRFVLGPQPETNHLKFISLTDLLVPHADATNRLRRLMWRVCVGC